MASAGFLKQLRSLLPESDWQPVLSALRQDRLVWAALEDDTLCSQALELCGKDTQAWNPARLGLLSLGYAFPEKALHEKPASQIEPDLASRLLALSSDPQEAREDLTSAMLAALLARESQHLSNQWQKALADVFDKFPTLAATVLACLYAIAPDPVILLTSFLTGNPFPEPAERRRLLIHAILANPMEVGQRVSLFVQLLAALPNAEQLDCLAWMKQNNQAKLSRAIADSLLGSKKARMMETRTETTPTGEDHFDVDTAYTQAMLQKLSGKEAESKQTLANALDQIKSRQEQLLDALDAFNPSAPVVDGERLPGEAEGKKEREIPGPTELIKVVSDQIQLGDMDAASATLHQAQALYPDNPDIARLQADIARQNGRSIDTIDALQTAVMLKPEDISLRKSLATSYEEQGNWKDALDERRSILKFFPEPPEQELLSLATTAIRARQLGVAETACATVLELQPDSGQANAIYGELLHARGEDEQALLHLTRATTLSPDLPAPWLVISRIYRDQGNETFSIDTLKAAAQVLPDSPEIQFALGENCLANSSPSEALVYLRKAYKYDPSSPVIRLRLAENLIKLGLYDEADRILTEARVANPSEPDLSMLHARVMLGLGNLNAALDAITQVLETRPNRVNTFSLLAEILEAAIDEKTSLTDVLNAHPKLMRLIGIVQETLESALASQPESLDLQMLSADLLVEKGAPEEALVRYRSLLQKLPYKHPAMWRAQFGLGRIALKLGQLDAALVALKEASQLMPERSDILKSLAETYRAANLPKEAMETSRAVVELLPGNTECHLWRADLCLRLDDPAEASLAIEKALALEPDRSDLVLMHTRALLAAGDTTPAQARLDALTARTGLDPMIYKTAASLYSEMDLPTKTSACLKKAVEVSTVPDSGLLAELAQAYAGENDPGEALRTIDQALDLDENNEELVLQRCALLDRLGQSEEARDYLITMLDQTRTGGWSNHSLSLMHARLAELLRESGDAAGALRSASQAQALDPDEQTIQHLVLQLQRGALITDIESLQARIHKALAEPVQDQDYPLTLVESALDCGLVDEALRVTELINETAEPVRLAAIKARLDALADDKQDAVEQFEAARSIQDPPATFTIKLARLISLSGAALSMRHWQKAFEFSQAALSLAPDEPQAALTALKALIFEREESEFYDSLKIQSHRSQAIEISAGIVEELLAMLPAREENANMPYWLARSAGLVGAIVDKKDISCPPDLHPNEFAGSIPLLIAAGQIREVERMLETWPENREIRRYHATALIEREPGSAANDADLLLVDDPTDPVAQALKAFTCQDDAFLAYEAIEKALSVWNDEPAWHTYAASLSQSLGNIQGRIDHALELTKLLPDSSEYQMLAGSAYLDAGQTEQAIHCLRRAALLEPHAKAVWLLLGQACQRSGDKREALEALEHAIAIDPKDTQPLLLSGQVALSGESYDLAAARARQVLEINPEEPGGLLLLTGTLAKQGRHEEALNTLESASLALRRSLPVQVEQLLLTQAIKGPEAILEQLEALGARNREDPRVLKALAECYSAIGHNEQAEQSAMEALKLAGDDASLHYLTGRTQRARGQLDQAIDHLAEAIRLEPSNVEAYLELAQAHVDRRQYEQAVRIYQQATIICPDDHRPYFQAGMLLKDGADFAAAEVMLKKASNLAPADLNIRSQLGALMALNFVHHTQDALTRS
jgi:tetratricopeptide (TPR) repeat protein